VQGQWEGGPGGKARVPALQDAHPRDAEPPPAPPDRGRRDLPTLAGPATSPSRADRSRRRPAAPPQAAAAAARARLRKLAGARRAADVDPSHQHSRLVSACLRPRPALASPAVSAKPSYPPPQPLVPRPALSAVRGLYRPHPARSTPTRALAPPRPRPLPAPPAQLGQAVGQQRARVPAVAQIAEHQVARVRPRPCRLRQTPHPCPIDCIQHRLAAQP
jgi:hypothetical protein